MASASDTSKDLRHRSVICKIQNDKLHAIVRAEDAATSQGTSAYDADAIAPKRQSSRTTAGVPYRDPNFTWSLTDKVIKSIKAVIDTVASRKFTGCVEADDTAIERLNAFDDVEYVNMSRPSEIGRMVERIVSAYVPCPVCGARSLALFANPNMPVFDAVCLNALRESHGPRPFLFQIKASVTNHYFTDDALPVIAVGSKAMGQHFHQEANEYTPGYILVKVAQNDANAKNTLRIVSMRAVLPVREKKEDCVPYRYVDVFDPRRPVGAYVRPCGECCEVVDMSLDGVRRTFDIDRFDLEHAVKERDNCVAEIASAHSSLSKRITYELLKEAYVVMRKY